MTAEIEYIEAKTLVGVKVTTSLATDRPESYWRPFKMRLSEIDNALTEQFFSVSIMDMRSGPFTPTTEFEKWAAVEVSNITSVPVGMEVLEIPSGKYAVFVYKGLAKDFPDTARFIYGQWIPNSGHEIDNRPHFMVMGKDYRPDDPNATELVYVPIKD
jgi:AraC family transcriptional regulator